MLIPAFRLEDLPLVKLLRFVVCAWDSYEARGGLADAVFTADTLAEVQEFTDTLLGQSTAGGQTQYDYYHVLDLIDGRVVSQDNRYAKSVRENTCL